MCLEYPSLSLGDESFKIILSATGDKEDVSEELKSFLAYVAGKAPGSDFTQRLDELVEKARAHIEWRKEYMTLLERDERMREEGRKEGRAEERARTEREAQRADAERQRADAEKERADLAEKDIERLKKEIEALQQIR